MSDFSLTLKRAGRILPCRARQGQTVLEVLQRQGIPITAPCGGNGTCGKCRIRLQGADGSMYRLACRTEALPDMVVELDSDAPMSIQDEGHHLAFTPDADASGLGIAIDVGTTTLVCRLFDLQAASTLGVATHVNPQVVFGSDVISRIDASKSGHLAALNESVLTALCGLITTVCTEAGVEPAQITRIALAGNTVMEHLAANLPPDGIGVSPFTPLSLFGSARAIEGLPAPVFFAPAVAGYVGGDITAGLLATQVNRASKPQLFVDLGTNGELALGDSHGITCCATAAGPVFEGAGIFFGMPALPGAIRAVELSGGNKSEDSAGGGSGGGGAGADGSSGGSGAGADGSSGTGGEG
ncbi:MAG: ASKHA domain-containing protein, partial [Coriobacteriales bacterium]|nr:ASKHA domain-containing protein [Coriobacteriales bacterium]